MDSTLRTSKSNHHLCLRLASLSRTGDVNLTLANKTWEALHPNLQAEMIRDCMGRISSSTFELSHAVGCTDGEKIRRMSRYMEKGDKQDQHNDHTACPFCNNGQDSRYHRRFECPSTEAIMAQINITRGGILATTGFSLWFDTNLRANIIHLNNSPIHIPPELILNNLTPTINSDNTEHRRFDNRRDILQAHTNNSSWFPTDRIALLEWEIHKAPPTGGINRPDDVVSAFIRDFAERVPTAGTIRVPWSLEQTREVRQQDYVQLTHNRYAIPTIRNPLQWHDMTHEDPMDQTNMPSGKIAHQPDKRLQGLAGALRDVWPSGRLVPDQNHTFRTCGWPDAQTSWKGNSHSSPVRFIFFPANGACACGNQAEN